MNKLEMAIKASTLAGAEILRIYNDPTSNFSVEIKSDNSPLTIADRKSQIIITRELSVSGIPILSEEGRKIEYDDRKDWNLFWLVDPLDGTKEFIKKNGEFTVNIALIEDGLPILGVIYIPVSGLLYFGAKDKPSRKININKGLLQLHEIFPGADLLENRRKNKTFTAVVSRSHLSKETEMYLEEIRSLRKEKGLSTDIEYISRGSSLKICMVAEGLADVYPRFGPTMEWDTAAGHAIAKFAGRKLVRADNGEELRYNKKSLLNPNFIVE